MPFPPFHPGTVRVFSLVPFAGFILARQRRSAGDFFTWFFCIAPAGYRVRVSRVVHEYRLRNRNINEERAAGESK
jgi:hypothetical protein